MKPVRTREDCIDWLTMEEVEREVFGAVVGARQHFLKYDFAAQAAEDPDSDTVIQDGTVVDQDGHSWVDRSCFLEYMLKGIVWRTIQLAESKGVQLDLRSFAEEGLPLGPRFASIAEALADPYFAYLAGEVKTVTKADIDAMPVAERKAFKAALRTAKPATVASA